MYVPRHRAWIRPTIIARQVLWPRGSDWFQAAEQVWWPTQLGGTGPCNPWGLASSHKNSQQFIFLILGLNLPFVHCYCATLRVIPPLLGNWERLPPGACVPQILAVAAACKEALLRKEPLLLAYSLIGAPRQWSRAGAIHFFKWPCPKDSYCLYCNLLCHLGTGNRQGRRELLRWTVNLRAVDLNLFCLLTMQELRNHPDI